MSQPNGSMGPSTASSSVSPSPPLSRIGLNAHKAGMEGIDKAKIDQIILEASKGSKYYENEVRREQQVTKRVNAMLDNLKRLTPAQIQSALKTVDKELEALEKTRDLAHIIVHVDMDAFYAAVETKNNPRLKDVPMAVGGYSMLSTSNYLARRYGVRAAMPGFIGKKLCPNLVIVKPHHEWYYDVSKQVREVLRQYDPHFSPMGLDEAYLDLTDYVKRKMEGTSLEHTSNASVSPKDGGDQVRSDQSTTQGLLDERQCDANHPTSSSGEHRTSSPQHHDSDDEDDLTRCKSSSPGCLPSSNWQCAEHVVEEMRSKIFKATGLTASAGIAPNKMLAKVASDKNKPNGQYSVTPTREGVLQFVQQLPIRKVTGIGKVSERMLNAIGVTMCRDLYDQRAVLHLLFSAVSSQYFHCISLGIGSTDVHRTYERKSMSTERTFGEISEPAELLHKCKELCQSLAEDMSQEGVKSRTVTLKLKTVHFEVKSRATKVSKLVSSAEDLYQAASGLLRAEIASVSPHPLCLRLMGVRVSSFENDKQDSRQDTLDAFLKRNTLFPSKSQPATTCTQSTHHDILDSGSESELILEPNNALSEYSSQQVQDRSSEQESHHNPIETAACPICNHQVPVDNMLFNRHIDECLNYTTLNECVTSPPSSGPITADTSCGHLVAGSSVVVPSQPTSTIVDSPLRTKDTSAERTSSVTLSRSAKSLKLSSTSPSSPKHRKRRSNHSSPMGNAKKRFRTLEELFKNQQ